MVVGGALTSIETVEDEFGHKSEEMKPNALVFLGIGVMLASWIPYLAVGEPDPHELISLYNSLEPASPQPKPAPAPEAGPAAAPEAVAPVEADDNPYNPGE
jgi:hypothetical protein